MVHIYLNHPSVRALYKFVQYFLWPDKKTSFSAVRIRYSPPPFGSAKHIFHLHTSIGVSEYIQYRLGAEVRGTDNCQAPVAQSVSGIPIGARIGRNNNNNGPRTDY